LLHDWGVQAERHILVAPKLLGKQGSGGDFMPDIVGIDHLVLSVGDFARSKTFYNKLLTFLGFKLKHEYDDMAGWSNGKTLFWIAAADAQGRKHKYRKGDIGFHHYAFEMASRKHVDALGAFLEENEMTIVDPPGEYYGRDYYAVYFTDPDGMKLEAMIWAPPEKRRAKKRKPARRKKTRRKI
jgi:catechol 2,3-dioxygenase-like lactoylglutathione lyase family enzyme